MADETEVLRLFPTIERSTGRHLNELKRLLVKYDYTEQHADNYQYGTAGFRYQHNELPPIMLRVGVAASLMVDEAVVGVMVTASHNTDEYNGVKLAAGSDGGMINESGEEIAMRVVNERNIDALVEYILEQQAHSAVRCVHIGRDTRDHSPALACLVKKAILCLGGVVVYDHGVVTTPQLHHAVKHAAAITCDSMLLPSYIPLRLNVGGYYDLLVHSYLALLATTYDDDRPSTTISRVLTVDCACGVGYPHLMRILDRIGSSSTRNNIQAVNAPDAGPLNEACGSEYVQKQQDVPKLYDTPNADLSYAASLDGDADRVVFFTASPSFQLLDGDKIACLIGNFIHNQLELVCGECTASPVVPRLGVVQTAYANGASTKYLTKNNVPVVFAKTGVKHVHKAAHDNYDVGVYFEANGHGTILFGNKFYDFLNATKYHVKHSKRAWLRLSLLPGLVNQAVGDALSDLLLVDAILQIQGTSISEWANLYQDLPSKQCKVAVPDRSQITTNENETRCLQPAGLQKELDIAMEHYKGRAFVRPSGTEAVVRVYAEAPTTQAAQALAQAAQDAIATICKPSRSRI